MPGKLLLLVALLGLPTAAPAAMVETESGSTVVVVYNTRMKGSKGVAEHYAQKRRVPDSQVFGFELPESEAMSRADYLEKLEKPLLKRLEGGGLLTYQSAGGSVVNARRIVSAKVRYAVLCYGVPTTILPDPTLVEPGVERLPAELRRNGAAVDSQLAFLPRAGEKPLLWAGPLDNPAFRATNVNQLDPTNGVLMVTRLDGPSAEIARGLVDKAIQAETSGLWGRAYIDARGLTEGGHLLGDQWMLASAEICRRAGFETVLDTNAATFSAGFPMCQIGIYAGWYDGGVSGPFARPTVEFMPGAFAYHLHSFNAQTIRSATATWVGPLLAKGATCTFGSVDEPYLSGTLVLPEFFGRLIFGRFSFAEAAYAAQVSLSWQNIVVGDPLYRPFARRPDLLHAELEQNGNPLVEWSHLRVVNLNLASGADLSQAISYLERAPKTRKSAVLTEKLADLYWANKALTDALDTYPEALKRNPSPMQKQRLMLTLARKRAILGPEEKAYALFEQFLKEFPDYPEPLTLYHEMLPLAKRMQNAAAIERCEKEIKRLSPAPAGGK